MAQPHKGDRKVVTVRIPVSMLAALDAWAAHNSLDRNAAVLYMIEKVMEDLPC